MFYKLSNYEITQDIICNTRKINYITRDDTKVKIYYENWSNKIKFDSSEEALMFMTKIHKILNRKGILRKIFDLII